MWDTIRARSHAARTPARLLLCGRFFRRRSFFRRRRFFCWSGRSFGFCGCFWFGFSSRLANSVSLRCLAALRARFLSFANQLVGFFLRHLTATDHVLNEVARALDSERGEAGRRSYHVAEGSRHLASSLEADFMSAGGKLCHRVSDILASMSGAALRWRRRRSWLFGRRRVVVRAYRFGHLLRMGTARRGYAQSVSGPARGRYD